MEELFVGSREMLEVTYNGQGVEGSVPYCHNLTYQSIDTPDLGLGNGIDEPLYAIILTLELDTFLSDFQWK